MIEKIGDWVKVGKLIANIGTEMKAARDQSLMQFGLKAEKVAVEHLSKQDLKWRSLAASTLASKRRQGLSEKKLIATSAYFQSITSWVEGDKVYAGVKKTARNKDGESIADIAKMQEFGTREIPARPLWQPTFEETWEWHKANNSPVVIFVRKIKQYL